MQVVLAGKTLDEDVPETDLKNTTMKDYTKVYRFSPELTAGKKTKGEALSDSLDFVTYYVPKLDDVQKGDIIQAKYRKDPIITTVNYGIVTDIIKDNNKVTNIKVVFMSKEQGCACSCDYNKIPFTTDVSTIKIRRLMKYESISWLGKDSEMIYRKDVFDLRPADARIEIQGMKESTQKNKDKWRFIPNTGEYLMLSGIKFTGKNALGIELTGRSFEVNFCGAADRDYQAENTSGNIYNNTAGSFEVAFFDKNYMKVENGTITQLPENKAVYEYRKTDGKDAASFLVNTSGKLIYSEGTGGGAVKIGVRPVSSAQAYPGDDLLLQFKIKGSEEIIQTDKKDYIAVYDKKMLWRANLYIDEKTGDWNNVHPWNAPPAGDKIAGTWADSNSKSYLANWNASDWGCNEWNRSLKVENYKENSFEGLNILPVGNGGQVTNFVSFTPLRPIAGTMAAPDKNKNVISNTIAYNYPEHAKEGSSKGDPGSMDSPFDFNKKMLVQQLQLNKWYTANGVKKETAGTKYDSSNYDELHAPSNSWYHYELSTTSNFIYGKDESNKDIEAAFIPGIGNFIKYGVGYAQNVLLSGETGDKEQIKKNFAGNDLKGKDGVYEAGTDCVGFANRAASYNGSIYKWEKTKPGWTEYENGTGTNDLKLTHDNYSRTYPRTAKDKKDGVSVGENGKVAINIFTTRGGGYDNSAYVNLNKQGLLDSRDLENKKQLMKIVPGDIFVKCSSARTDDEMDSHIAIVASVPDNAEELTVGELLDSIILIEAEISWRVQSVIKTFSLGDYGNLHLEEKIESLYKKIYPNADNLETENGLITQPTFTLKNKHYAIRRLICKEE